MKWLMDENFNGRILSGLLTRYPDLDVVRAQDTELYQQPDPVVLEWAAQENRILVTHDIGTIPDYAYERVEQGLVMPGVLIVPKKLDIGTAIRELATIIEASEAPEWENRVVHLPL